MIADRMGQYVSGTAPELRASSPFIRTPTSTILSVASAMKRQANMASKTSMTEAAPVLDMAELGRQLAARRAEIGPVEVPRNAGTRRTASKRALLDAIEEAGGKW